MSSTRLALSLAAVSGLLLLNACGLSHDGSSADPARDPAPDVADAQSADPAGTRSAGERAAIALPRFDSVTRSSIRDGSGVTADTASVSFDGTEFVMRVHREDGSSLACDTATHTLASEDASSLIAGNSDRHCALSTHSDASLSAVSVYASWNDTDPTDYLARGYWMHVEGDLTSPELIEVEVGAFLDGPELSGSPALPGFGTASYRGHASGFYAYAHQGGAAEVGEFQARATFTADFVASIIDGCIGCDGQMLLARIRTTPAGEESTRPRIRLGAAAFDSTGTFGNRNVSVEIDGRTVTRTDGPWGGRFSSIPDGEGAPLLMAGPPVPGGANRAGTRACSSGRFSAPRPQTLPDCGELFSGRSAALLDGDVIPGLGPGIEEARADQDVVL